MRTTRSRSQFECAAEAQGTSSGRAGIIQRGQKNMKREPQLGSQPGAGGLYYCLGHGATDAIETVSGHHHFGGESTGG
jgi:hypothetical protein